MVSIVYAMTIALKRAEYRPAMTGMQIQARHTPDSNTTFQTTHGVFDGFRPGGLPTPDWAFSISPTGPDEANALEGVEAMNEWFMPSNIDAVIMEFSGQDMEQAGPGTAFWLSGFLAFWLSGLLGSRGEQPPRMDGGPKGPGAS